MAIVINECLILFSFKLMMEVALTTRAFKFRDAWLELLPKLWEYVKMDCPKLLQDCPEDEDADALDDG